jgi:hypothetical protein
MVQLVDEVRVDEHQRPEPPYDGGEAATLLGFWTTSGRRCSGSAAG